MARKLRSKDLLILRKLALRERLLKLSDNELDYLVNLILDGMESLHCVKKEHVDALIEVVSMRISKS